jgi:F-type H+-transporting ATPase subunit gamma
VASLRETRERINSVRSTLKITSAMKLVASAKLRKAQKAIESLRPYERTLAEILSAVRTGEASSRADGNYFSDRFAEKPISAPPSTTPTHASPVPSVATGKTVAALPDDEGSAAAGFVAPNPVPATAGSEDGCRGAGMPNRKAATAIVAIASNSSLCGGFNANVIRKALETIQGCEGEVELYPIGRKMADGLRRAGYTAAGDWNELIGHPAYDKSAALARSLSERYQAWEISRVLLVYTRFKSASSQEPVVEIWLPFDFSAEGGVSVAGGSGDMPPYILEPDAEALVAQLLPQVMLLKFHAALLDSAAAEQAARTIAMQTATDNAEDLLGELTLEYNKGRQQKITAEILDLLGGAAQ